MNILLVTTPIRPQPTNFPPLGSLSIISYLRKRGYETNFYHIDAIRPSYDEALKHIIAQKPDILAISSVVSTAYAYTKRLSLDVKNALPETLIIVGGSLAASAEVLLRRTGVDLCATGEGETVMLNVVRRAETTRRPSDFSDVAGLALLDPDGAVVNTGFEQQLSREEIYDINWDDLEKAADIGIYVSPAHENDHVDFWFQRDVRSYQSHRVGKSVGSLPASKGCVARCTFCHRWEKGIRYIPVDILRERIRELVDRYNVGFLHVVDENFGTDGRWLAQFCEMIKPFDLLWRVAGMRVNCITPEYIEMMKDAGCVAILYGMETGSADMLQVMEKKVKVEDNYNAMRWTIGAKLHTVVQLVIGMPGESPRTIDETAAFASFANSLDPDQRPWDLSINYAQALPGTPLYEFARRTGLIDASLDGEEAYLMQVSDRDAADEHATLNFTPYPYFIHQSWRSRIQLKTSMTYIRKFGKAAYAEKLASDTRYFARKSGGDTGYFSHPKRQVERTGLSDTIHEVREAEEVDSATLPTFMSLIARRKLGMALLCYPEFFAPLLPVLPLIWILIGTRRLGVKRMVQELRVWLLAGSGRKIMQPKRSLRKVVLEELPAPAHDIAAMEPLRRGR